MSRDCDRCDKVLQLLFYGGYFLFVVCFICRMCVASAEAREEGIAAGRVLDITENNIEDLLRKTPLLVGLYVISNKIHIRILRCLKIFSTRFIKKIKIRFHKF